MVEKFQLNESNGFFIWLKIVTDAVFKTKTINLGSYCSKKLIDFNIISYGSEFIFFPHMENEVYLQSTKYFL